MKDVLSVSKKPAPQSHRSPKRPEKGAPKNARPSLPASAFLPTTRAEADEGIGKIAAALEELNAAIQEG